MTMPAVQTGFLSWLATACLQVPVRVHRHTDRRIDLRFPSLPTQAPAATLIEDHEINVAEIWQRTCWGFLPCNDSIHA